MDVYLMRHGQPDPRTRGETLFPQSEAHIKAQAEKLGKLGVTIVLTSPIARARATALVVAEALDVEAIQCHELGDWGLHSNRMIPELKQATIQLAQQHIDPFPDNVTAIVAVTHAPLIQNNTALSDPSYGDFAEVPTRMSTYM